MTLNDTLFVGTASNPDPLPLLEILNHYNAIRDAITELQSYQSESLSTLVGNASFVYAFNAYKSIGLLLPEFYHESGSAILRQLWEVSLNLHWIAVEPESRSSDFSNFTTIGYRKYLTKSGREEELDDFDTATERFQEKFRFTDRRDRERIQGNFSSANVHDRASVLGDPWEREYELLYHLTSLHAHGSPDAILQQVMVARYENSETIANNSVCLVAINAIRLMVRNVEVMSSMGIIAETKPLDDVYRDFRAVLQT